MKVLLDIFQLNGHTLGFHPKTQKVQPHLLTQGLTLGVKGLNPSLTHNPSRFKMAATISKIKKFPDKAIKRPVNEL